MPCSPSSLFPNNFTSMASSGFKLGTDYLDFKRTARSDFNAANSDSETVDINEEEDDDIEPTSTKNHTRSKRQTTKRKAVRRRRITANIAGTKYDVGKASLSIFADEKVFVFLGMKTVIS